MEKLYVLLVLAALFMFVVVEILWRIDIWFNKTDFAKNLKFYRLKVFRFYYHKLIVVPRQLRYDGDDEFHSDLNQNLLAMMVMNREELQEYLYKLMEARERVGKHGKYEEVKNA